MIGGSILETLTLTNFGGGPVTHLGVSSCEGFISEIRVYCSTGNPCTLSTNSFVTNVSCNGGSDGTATATVTGGTPNYIYSWSDGQTTATATNLIAGNYQVIQEKKITEQYT